MCGLLSSVIDSRARRRGHAVSLRSPEPPALVTSPRARKPPQGPSQAQRGTGLPAECEDGHQRPHNLLGPSLGMDPVQAQDQRCFLGPQKRRRRRVRNADMKPHPLPYTGPDGRSAGTGGSASTLLRVHLQKPKPCTQDVSGQRLAPAAQRLDDWSPHCRSPHCWSHFQDSDSTLCTTSCSSHVTTRAFWLLMA